jgi:glycosyltransferase involved in cell wall biosynthesis
VKVCFLIDDLSVGGIEGQLLLLLKHLDRSAVKPTLCLLNGGNRSLERLVPVDCPLIRLGVRSLRHPSTAFKAFRFARYLRRRGIDVLHPLFTDSLYFGTLAAKLAGKTRVVRFRVDLGYWMKWTDRWLARTLSKLVDATMVNCEACRRTTIDREWAPPDTVTVIPNGVDLARFGPRTITNGERQRVGIVANLRPVKNLQIFIRAAAQLSKRHPTAEFEIAGEGELRTELQGLIDNLGAKDQVKLIGSIADVPAFLAGLDIAVLCSRSEGSPNAIMEYMAAGLPSVVTDVGGNRELIEHERNGLVVPSDDLDSLTAAIGRLLDDRRLAFRMSEDARRRAWDEFGVETQARRYEEFYRKLRDGKFADIFGSME